ncbi:hypothetical protein [Microbacterium sp. BK668]|uniref:hypothetical protein n=1 Tax=Microbacterium sp. BK668 TaxID=2512118 RepID=UPI00105CFCE4|nr:hypothetical protein [Microbacterium sp. BK668]
MLPDDVIIAANDYASTNLARYKRDALLEVLAPFRTPQEGRDTVSPLLFGTLLCRALRYQAEHDRPGGRPPAPTDARAEAHPVLELMKMGAGPAFVYWFMDSPALSSYFSSTDSREFAEERAWVEELGPPPSIWSYAGHYDEDPDYPGL